MTITVFTSNQPRHVALIEAMARVADEVYAIQECNTVFPGQISDFYRRSDVMQRYFARVMAAESVVFGGPRILSGNVSHLAIKGGDLNRLDLSVLAPALDADVFIVFGASYIKGALCDLLVERRAYNIHMGTSPYYRGSSCNFWALADRRPEYVGATIHLLSRGLDSGPILFHAIPSDEATDGFLLGMRAVKAAHDGLLHYLSSDQLDSLTPIKQDRSLEYRYTRNVDFTDEVAQSYLANEMSPLEISAAIRARVTDRFLNPFFG